MRFSRMLVAAALVAASCGNDDGAAATSTTTTTPPENATVTTPPASVDARLEFVPASGHRGGNRVVLGSLDLGLPPIEVQLERTPLWVVGAYIADRTVWVVASEDGSVSAFAEANGAVEPFPLGDVDLPPGAPPSLLVGGSAISLLQPSTGWAPLAGHAMVDDLPIVIGEDGSVVVGTRTVDGIVALPDTRVVVSAGGVAALLTEPTDDLTHGVLGDRIEARTITVLETDGEVSATLAAPAGTVFEAVSPMWADVDGDGTEEIIATASDASVGARLVVYEATGQLRAESPPIGTGNRWLNLLGVGAVGPQGEIEVVEVRTPHIGGIVRWYRLVDGRLELVASAERYSTHRIGSRNLDQGVIVDATGDGRLDVVVPIQDQSVLVALTRDDDTASAAVSAPLGAALATNLNGVSRPDGTASLALGTADGRLLIWP